MELNDYQLLAHSTAKHPEGAAFIHCVTGLAEEIGEFLGKVKRLFRDDGGVLTEERKLQMKKELGDIQWYLSETCLVLDMTLEEVATCNLSHLKDRQQRNVICGSGDNR